MDASAVRLAQVTDLPGVLSLLEAQHKETGVFDFDDELVSAIVARLVVAPGDGVVGVIDVGNMIVASVGLALMPGAWYTRRRTLYELWSFVLPEHRRSAHHTRALFDFAKECSDRLAEAGRPVPLLSALVVTPDTIGKQNMYNRKFVPKGTFYLYEPKVA